MYHHHNYKMIIQGDHLQERKWSLRKSKVTMIYRKVKNNMIILNVQ